MDARHHQFGHMGNMVIELLILRRLRVSMIPHPFRLSFPIAWVPLPLGWVKINTYGAFSSVSGSSIADSVFWDSEGQPLYASFPLSPPRLHLRQSSEVLCMQWI